MLPFVRRTRRMAVVGILVLSFCAAIGGGCGDGDGDGAAAGDAESELTTVQVGVIPIADVAPLYLGMDKGFFRDEGLEIKPQLAQGGAAIVPSVVSGDAQVGYSNIGSMLVAQTKGLPIQVVGQGVEGAASKRKAWTALLVKGSSSIREPKDLEGKTIALNALHELNEVVVKAALERQGVDVDTLEFTEVGFPDMAPALEAGRVDAITASEPFRTLALEGGARVISAPIVEVEPNMTFAVYFASKQAIEQEPETIDAFVRAMNRSLDYAAAHQDEARAILPSYAKVDEALAQKINLPVWTEDLNVPSIEATAELGKTYGLLDELPDVGELIYEPAG